MAQAQAWRVLRGTILSAIVGAVFGCGGVGNAAIAGSRKVLIDKAGHYPFIEHPEKFNQVVREFLKPQS